MNQEIKKRTKWFMDARFGMFIHWGLYAIPACGEWMMSEKEMPAREYEKYFYMFDPVDFNPRQWAKLAKKAGMKYAVLTAKHHDGFCLFDSDRLQGHQYEGRPGFGEGISGCVPGRRN